MSRERWVPLPRGQGRVLEALVRQGVASAKELAAELKITPIAVRQHLRGLARRDLAVVARVRSGKPGHPEQLWIATPAGRAWVLPGRYASLTFSLLTAIGAVYGGEGLVRTIHLAAQHYLDSLEPKPLPRRAGFEQRVQALLLVLDGLYAFPQLEIDGRQHTIAVRNCVFQTEVAGRFPQVYEFYRGLAEALLGRPVELQEPSAADPRGTCFLRFSRP